ncbi:MAG TPA: hypothetical protein VHX90_05790 [Verrucomicrobiae bacterium]|jgi:hypothetical protein|nr:hypothetical protein [Verrucomicrobiae bacterium]
MNNGLPAVGRLSPELLDFLIMAGAIGLVLLGVFFWALFFRKGTKRRVRRRKHKHRSLNRSIAKIGGLPPVREEKKTDAPAPP